MLYTPLLPDVAGGLVDARFVAIPLANALRGVQAIRGRVDGVDFDGAHGHVHRPRRARHAACRGIAWC